MRARGLGLGLTLVAAFSGCSSEESRPPPASSLTPELEKLRSCRDIQGAALQGARIVLEGQPAACAAEGLICPLGAAFDATPRCNEGGRSQAVCIATHWTLRCADAGADGDFSGPRDAN
jgi:hypothetical protein